MHCPYQPETVMFCYNQTVSDVTGIYIHLPFCRRKCGYCSFTSYEHREAAVPDYLQALQTELKQRAAGIEAGSVYFGGGTPSLLAGREITGILSFIKKTCRLDPAAEISLEANPDSVSADWLKTVRRGGATRLSLGVQSFDDGELKLLGRLHDAARAGAAIREARNAGFDNLNIDLMFGLPEQRTGDFQNTLTETISYAPEHISLYALSLEPDTPMGRATARGELPPADPDRSADLYELAASGLAAAGYRHYEISNWARPGRECRHNLVYWHNRPYLGFGVAAHSWKDGHRFANTADLDAYTGALKDGGNPPRDVDEIISAELELAETIILGLRLAEGVSKGDIHHRFGIDLLQRYDAVISELVDLGLLVNSRERIYLSERGRLLGNEVFWRFLPE
jgi:putative oxygen-independent coproporphyrinogen III oxidase